MIFLSFIIWQFQNIRAFYESRVYSKEELVEKVSISKVKIKNEIEEKYPNIVVQDISAEDELDLLKGKISTQEISEKYNIPINNDDKKAFVLESKNENISNMTEQGKNINNGNMTDEDRLISEHIGQMYGIKAKYLSKLGQLERDAISEYKSNNSNASKEEIGYKYASIGGSYESACDSEVEYVLNSLEKKLITINADSSITKSLRASYYEEKQAKKAYYLSMFQ